MHPPSGKPPLRVLIVDDQRDTLMTLGILLRSEGMVTELAQRSTGFGRAARRSDGIKKSRGRNPPPGGGLRALREERASLLLGAAA